MQNQVRWTEAEEKYAAQHPNSVREDLISWVIWK